MGAPGYYILCPEGHLIGIIEDDLCWGDPEDESSVYKELEKLQTSRCHICNKLAKYEFCHYGDINDCLYNDNKIEWNIKENRFIIPLNHKGNVILRSKPVYVKAPKSTIDNINEHELSVTKDIHGYTIIFDRKNCEVVFRLKENVARELRDKLDFLLPKS